MNWKTLSGAPKSDTPQSEVWRRAVVRIATSLLNLLIGPAGAWTALGIRGVVAYIIVHTLTKWLSAEYSARNRKTALAAYRRSPWLLVLGGLFPLSLETWLAPVILVPIVLGGFEGSFWCSFHGIRHHTKPPKESDKDSVKWFQILELRLTLVASITVIFLAAFGLEGFAGPLGALFSVVAWAIPMDEKASSAEMTIDSEGIDKSGTFGRKATGSFGTIQIIRTWCMRIVALDAGGISALSLMVGVSAIVGFWFKEWYQRKLDREGVEKKVIQAEQWRIGNQVTAVGLLIMSSSFITTLDVNMGMIFYAEKVEQFHLYFSLNLVVFLLGYLVCNSGVDGILRPMEIEISGARIRGEGGKIGLRERIKFKQQMKLLSFSLVMGSVIATLGLVPSVTDVLLSYIFVAMLYCGFNIHKDTLAELRDTYTDDQV